MTQILLTNKLNWGRQELSLIEKRTLILVLEKLRPYQCKGFEQVKQTPYGELPIFFRFTAKELETKDTVTLGRVGDSLLKRIIRLQDGGAYNLFIHSKYENGILEVSFNPELLPAFCELNNGHTKVEKESLFALSSPITMRLYELLSGFIRTKRDDKNAEYQSGFLVQDLEKLKELLGIENKYADFGTFRTRILDRAQSEINDKTNISFDWEISKKERKKVVQLQFHVTVKNNTDKKSTESIDNQIPHSAKGNNLPYAKFQKIPFTAVPDEQYNHFERLFFDFYQKRFFKNRNCVLNTTEFAVAIQNGLLEPLATVIETMQNADDLINNPREYFFTCMRNNYGLQRENICQAVIDFSATKRVENKTHSRNNNAQSVGGIMNQLFT